jgi:DNA-directed RNA polymerase specialized sigma24 family protein
LLSGPVLAYTRRKLTQVEEAKDVAQDALLAVLNHAHQCRAIHHPSVEQGERIAWAWAFTVVRRKVVDFRKQHARAREAVAEVSRLADEGTSHEEDAQGSLEELLWAAEQGARALIETRQPDDLYRDARAEEVAASVETVSRDIDSFRQVKLYGRRCLEVGRERGYEGPDARVQNLVSKQVERGKKAMIYGARAAARDSDAVERERLEHFARGLLQVGKTS